jgi:hypothetical protein
MATPQAERLPSRGRTAVMPPARRLLPAALLLLLAPPRTTVIVFNDVAVLPMDRPGFLEHQTVIVTDGKVTAIGPTSGTRVPRGARVIDGEGRTLMPGLIDAHVHMRSVDVPAYVASGILTVRNMWGHEGIKRLQREIASGQLTGPTIYSLSPGLDASPGSWPFTQFLDDAWRPTCRGRRRRRVDRSRCASASSAALTRSSRRCSGATSGSQGTPPGDDPACARPEWNRSSTTPATTAR